MDIFERYANESNIEADEKLENSDMNPETVLHESGGFYTAVERLIEERCIFMYSLLEKGVCVCVCALSIFRCVHVFVQKERQLVHNLVQI